MYPFGSEPALRGLCSLRRYARKEEYMKLRKPDGTVIDASISEGRNIVLSTMEDSPTIGLTKGLEEIETYELIEATDHDRSLLQKAGFKIKGLQ